MTPRFQDPSLKAARVPLLCASALLLSMPLLLMARSLSAQSTEIALLPGYESLADDGDSPSSGPVVDGYVGARWPSGWAVGGGVGLKLGEEAVACPTGVTSQCEDRTGLDVIRFYGEARYSPLRSAGAVDPFVGSRLGIVHFTDVVAEETGLEASAVAGARFLTGRPVGLLLEGTVGVLSSGHFTVRAAGLRLGVVASL